MSLYNNVIRNVTKEKEDEPSTEIIDENHWSNEDTYFNQLRNKKLAEEATKKKEPFIELLESIWPFSIAKDFEAGYSDTLDYVPPNTEQLLEKFKSKENSGWGFQKTVTQKYDDFNGKGPGTLYISDKKGVTTYTFYPAPPKEWVEEQNKIIAKADFVAKAPMYLAPFAAVAGAKTRGPVPQHIVYKGSPKYPNQQIKIPITPKGLKDAKITANHLKLLDKEINNVYNRTSTEVQLIKNFANQQGISIVNAEKYLSHFTPYGILKDTNKSSDEDSIYFTDEELHDMGFSTKTYGNQPMMSVDPSDIPTYNNARLDLNQAVHPTTYDKQNVIGVLLNKHGGLKGGRLNLQSVNSKGYADKRIIGSVFLTPYGKGGNFSAITRNKKSIAYQMFGSELEDFKRMGLTTEMKSGKTTTPLQGHHKETPLAVVLPAFEGVVKESPRYTRFVNVFLEELKGLGDMPGNIEVVMGHVSRDKDSPHSLTHQFTNKILGPSGQKFWTKEKLDQIVVYDKDGNAIGTKNDDLREEFIRDFIKELKKSIEVLDNATKSYEVLFSKQRLDPDYIIEWFGDKLPEIRNTDFIKDYVPAMMEKFEEDIKKEEAKDFVEQGSPSAEVRKANANEMLKRIFKKKPKWREWTVPERKWRMKEITGTPSKDYEDGWTFQMVTEYLEKNFMDSKKLQDLHKEFLSWEDVLDEYDR